jgi:hypothetical protein
MKKKIIRIIFILSLLLFCFYLIPFVFLYRDKSNIDYLMFSIIAERSTRRCEDDSAKAMSIFKFVTNNLIPPDKFHLPNDHSVFDILMYKYSTCDQQAHVMINLARHVGINGRLIFLYGNDSISHHSVCDLEINGKYRMFGPFFNKVFYTKQNCLASIEEIQNGMIEKRRLTFPNRFNLTSENYYHLFDKKYPYKIFKDNKIHYDIKEKRDHLIFDSWYSVFGDFGLKPYLFCYFKHNNISKLKQKRIIELLY